MSSHSSRAFLLSVVLHLLAAVLVLVATFVFRPRPPEMLRTFELVAGTGDNYMATEAPALGEPGGVKLDLPAPPAPTPVEATPPPVPVPMTIPPPEPSPVAPAPPPKKAPAPPPKKAAPAKTAKAPQEKTLRDKILQEVWRADANEKLRARRAREAEVKKQLKAKQDAAKAKALADRKAKERPKVARLNPAGIAAGVRNGSQNNTSGGAGGTELSVGERSEAEGYQALLEQKLREQLEKTPNLQDGITADADFRIEADGRLTRGKITRSSGNAAFDEAVLNAIRNVRMPARPKGVPELMSAPFSAVAR